MYSTFIQVGLGLGGVCGLYLAQNYEVCHLSVCACIINLIEPQTWNELDHPS